MSGLREALKSLSRQLERKAIDAKSNEADSAYMDARSMVGAVLAAGIFRDEATVKAEAIREAATAQRVLATNSRTSNGRAEHTDRADWLDDYANHIDPSRLEGATAEMGHDYSAWSDQDGALADWDCADGQATEGGKHYCDDHRVPVCTDCDKTEGLAQDDDEEWWCPEHLETQPEYEAPAGVVV